MFPAGLWAATQICSSLTQTAQLPSGVSVACGRRSQVRAPTEARASQGPVEQGGRAGCPVGPGCSAPARACGPYGISQRSVRSSVTRWSSRSSSAAGDGPGGELQEGEQLRHGLDDLGDGGGLAVVGAGWASDQASKSATQPRSTALSSRSQARSRQPGRAVSPCTSTRPASRARSQSCADLSRGQAQVGGGPFGGRVGEGALAVGARAVAAGAAGRRRPSGRRGRRRRGRRGPAGQFRGRRCALGRPGGRSAALGRCGHRSRGGGQRSRADESEPGVARGTGRHGGSLPVDGPKTQTECHSGGDRGGQRTGFRQRCTERTDRAGAWR